VVNASRVLLYSATLVFVATSCSACHTVAHFLPSHSVAVENLQLDGKDWVPLQKQVSTERGRDSLLEYLPAGQTLANWQEMVTVETFSTAMAHRPVHALDFRKSFMDKLSRGNAHVGSYVVAENGRSSMFAWKALADPLMGDQSGLVRVVEQPGGLQVLQYTARQSMTEEQLKRWRPILEQL
jgi:hypothetical protein